jgi:hypothetical protein
MYYYIATYRNLFRQTDFCHQLLRGAVVENHHTMFEMI